MIITVDHDPEDHPGFTATLFKAKGIGRSSLEALGHLMIEAKLLAFEKGAGEYSLNVFSGTVYAIGLYNGEQWRFYRPQDGGPNTWQVGCKEGEDQTYTLLEGQCLMHDIVKAQHLLDLMKAKGYDVKLCVFGIGRMQVKDSLP